MANEKGEILSADKETLIRLDERYDHLATKFFVINTVVGALITYTVMAFALWGVLNDG